MAPDREEVKLIAESLRRLNALVEALERNFSALAISDDVLRELLSELPEQFNRVECQLDRIERLMIALANEGKPGMKQITAELEQEILRGHIESLKRQLLQQHKNRDLLQEESAKYGPNVPLHITNQIIGASVEIDKTQSELEHFRELLK